MLVMRFADVHWPAPLSLHSMFKAQYKGQVIIIIIIIKDRSTDNKERNEKQVRRTRSQSEWIAARMQYRWYGQLCNVQGI